MKTNLYAAPKSATSETSTVFTTPRPWWKTITLVASLIIVAFCVVNILAAFSPLIFPTDAAVGVYPKNYHDLVFTRAYNEFLETLVLLVPAVVAMIWSKHPRNSIEPQQETAP